MSRGSANSPGGSDRNASREERVDREPSERTGAIPPDPAAELGGQLLDCVVRETLSAVHDEATIERIKAFAQRNASREVTEPEVAEELIRVIVRTRFGRIALPPELPGWLAETLLDDPDSQQRLQSLWNRARQVAS